MTERNRDYLKLKFFDGEQPRGVDFADLIETFVNKTDDAVQVESGNLVLSQGLGLGDSNRPVAGTLRFNSGKVQFHNGTTFVDLASGASGVFQPLGGSGAVGYAGGNVGVGPFTAATPPTFRLEVELGANATEADRARFGFAAIHNGSAAFQQFAHFSHRTRTSNTDYAVRQGPAGEVALNAPADQIVSLRQGGNQVRLALAANTGRVLINASAELASAGTAVLQVNGEAFKTGASNVWAIASDARLKEDVRDLEAGLAELLEVRPVRFRYNGKAGTPAGCEGVGIIGQEIERVFPEMVKHVPGPLCAGLEGAGLDEPEDALRMYDGSALTYVLVNAVKELAARVAGLESALAARGAAGHA